MKEVEVSLKGVFFYILRRWKSIVAAMVIVGLAFAGLKYYKDSKVVVNEDKHYDEAVAVKELSDQERDYLDSLYVYVQNMRTTNNERETSLIMKIDPDNVIREAVSYMIRVDDPTEIEGIKQAYEQALNGIMLKSYLSDEIGISALDISDTVYSSIRFSDTASSTASITVSILSDNVDDSEKIATAVYDFLIDLNRKLSESGSTHELVATGANIYQGTDAEVLARQSQYSAEIQSRNRSILDIEAGLKDEQLKYYMFISEDESVDDHVIFDNQPYKEAIESVSVKYLLLGMFAGMVLICGLHFFIYLFANKLDVDDNVEGLFGTYLIGTISGKDYGKPIYKLQHLGKRTFGFDESVQLISAKIKMAVRKDGVSIIGIMGCGIKKSNGKAANDIIDNLKKDGIEAILLDDPIYDPTTAGKLSEVDGVVLLEKAGVTNRTEIWKEIEMIKKCGINAEGLVITE